MTHKQSDPLTTTSDDQERRGFAAETSAVITDLSDEELAQVSGGCRKAGGQIATSLQGYKSIIAI